MTFQESQQAILAAQDLFDVNGMDAVSGSEFHCFNQREQMKKLGWTVTNLFKIEDERYVFGFKKVTL